MKFNTFEQSRVIALLSGIGAGFILALPARAADANPAPSSVGPPVVLFSSDSPAATRTPTHKVVAAAPTTRAAAPQAHTAPLNTKQLISPATATAKLAPPPEPRPALPLETVIQPLAASPQPVPTAQASPPAAKAPAN